MTRARLIVAIVIVAAAVAAIVSSSQPRSITGDTPKETDTPQAGCLTVPDAGETPSFLPDDLPFPDGSYATGDATTSATGSSVTLVVDSSLDDFVSFLREQWPQAGWAVGAGDREDTEAEAPFAKGGVAGRFRARSAYCEKDKTQVLVVITSPAALP